MRILHTSDWHLGHSLFNRKRFDEFQSFLFWLKKQIKEMGVDVLLISGDIFDTSTPSTQAQELYYEFLSAIARETTCRRVFVTAGNHDSASFIEAPKTLLKTLKVDVVGKITHNPSDEVFVVCDDMGKQQLIVCAVPYLREKDLRCARQGEGTQEREKRTLQAIAEHYRAVVESAILCRNSPDIPIVAMGHLYVAGSITKERLLGQPDPLYVGSLGQVPVDIFPSELSYVALGHIHMPQVVAAKENIQYSGSPLPMSFLEAQTPKRVVIVDVESNQPVEIKSLSVPNFQELIQIKGDWSLIESKINKLKSDNSKAWLEVIYESPIVIGELRARVQQLIVGSELEVLRIKNNQIVKEALSRSKTQKDLEQLTPEDVFEYCLKENRVDQKQQETLRSLYREVLDSLELKGQQ